MGGMRPSSQNALSATKTRRSCSWRSQLSGSCKVARNGRGIGHAQMGFAIKRKNGEGGARCYRLIVLPPWQQVPDLMQAG